MKAINEAMLRAWHEYRYGVKAEGDDWRNDPVRPSKNFEAGFVAGVKEALASQKKPERGFVEGVTEPPAPQKETGRGFVAGVKETPASQKKSGRRFVVGDKVRISDDPRISEEFRGCIGKIAYINSADQCTVDVGGGIAPECFHISHLAPYTETTETKSDDMKEHRNLSQDIANYDKLKERAKEAWSDYCYRAGGSLYSTVFEDAYIPGATEALASQWKPGRGFVVGDKTCKNCVFITDEDYLPFCVLKPLYTLVNPNDEACDEYVSKDKDQ